MNGGLGPAACWLTHKRLETWSRMAKERVGVVRKPSEPPNASEHSNTTDDGAAGESPKPVTSAKSSPRHFQHSTSNSSTEECQLLHEQHAVQPAQTVPAHSVNIDQLRHPTSAAGLVHSYLHHQSKSFPPRMHRTPSVSSQSSLESAPSRSNSCSQSHRGSSPQIRAFGPDGRSAIPTPDGGTICGHSHYQAYGNRSPSPLRAISLDARSVSPSSASSLDQHQQQHAQQAYQNRHYHDLRSGSPSGGSLHSLTGAVGGSERSPKPGNRCLSPLLIPPRGNDALAMGPASPLGMLQLDLYQRPEGPIYLTAPEDSVTLGKLHLRLQYDSKVYDLAVHLVEAHNLSSIEEGGFRDPYVRLSLDPEVDGRKRETSIHRGEAHPYFNEHFKFPVSRDQLVGRELLLQVFDYDRYSHNDIIGEVRIVLDELQLSKSLEIWADLLRAKKPPEDRPELLVSMSYLPHAERMTINIMKSRNLDVDANAEPNVRLYQIVNGKRTKKKRTKSPLNNDPANPVWNESFQFSFPPEYVQSCAFEIYVITTGGEGNALNCGIGPLELGSGKEHWLDITHPSSHKQSAMWHKLR